MCKYLIQVKEVNGSLVEDSTLNLGRSNQHFFVIDASPDDGLHEVTKGLFIGSQDAAANHQGLKNNSITHILNAAKYVKNHFPQVCLKCQGVVIIHTLHMQLRTHAYTCIHMHTQSQINPYTHTHTPHTHAHTTPHHTTPHTPRTHVRSG